MILSYTVSKPTKYLQNANLHICTKTLVFMTFSGLQLGTYIFKGFFYKKCLKEKVVVQKSFIHSFKIIYDLKIH